MILLFIISYYYYYLTSMLSSYSSSLISGYFSLSSYISTCSIELLFSKNLLFSLMLVDYFSDGSSKSFELSDNSITSSSFFYTFLRCSSAKAAKFVYNSIFIFGTSSFFYSTVYKASNKSS